MVTGGVGFLGAYVLAKLKESGCKDMFVPNPVNLGYNFKIPIKELADLIIKIRGFQGKIEWDSSMPDGQPRRFLDISQGYIKNLVLRQRLILKKVWRRPFHCIGS